MGSLTLQVIGDGTVGTKSKTFTISDADINRLVAAWKSKITTVALPSPTVTQAMVAFADNVMAHAKSDTLDVEARTATAAILPIVGT